LSLSYLNCLSCLSCSSCLSLRSVCDETCGVRGSGCDCDCDCDCDYGCDCGDLVCVGLSLCFPWVPICRGARPCVLSFSRGDRGRRIERCVISSPNRFHHHRLIGGQPCSRPSWFGEGLVVLILC
jgi:hypothetical protein